jgi:hypothetical protein
MFFAARLLALHLMEPWHFLLILNCVSFMVESAPPIIHATKVHKLDELESSYRSFYYCVFAIVCIPVCVLGMARKITRSQAAARAAADQLMQDKTRGMNHFQKKVAAAKLWHGLGKAPWGQQRASMEYGVGQDSLKRMLDRAFNAYNAAHVRDKVTRLEDFRRIPYTVFEQYLSPIEMGRGDTLSPWEFEQIKTRYITRCLNYKDVPESQLTNDSKNDEFAAVINDVFGESRVELRKKKTAEEYSNICIRRWAKAMDVVSTGTVPGSDSRSAAVGDWRNMISSLVMWLAVVTGFTKRIPFACQYNMDDTTVFLEQRIGKRTKTHVHKSVKDALRGKNLSFSFGVTKSKREKTRKKAANTQARTVKILFCSCADGTPICTVVKIKDESITQFKMQKITDSFYIVWDPKIPKSGTRSPAEPKSVRVRRTATIMKFAILPAIVLDMECKKRKQSEACQTFDEEGVAHDSMDSHAEDICYDRALLSFDGDFAQIEAILALEDVTAAFAEKNVELFKFAAGASMTQQPNDRSRCFYCLKKALLDKRVKIQEDIDVAMATLSPKYLKMLRKLSKKVPDKGTSKTSHATFKFFLSSCDAIFNSAFSITNIRGGWKKCGLSPFNAQVMMESYAFFEELKKVAPDAPQQVLAAVPRLAVFARDTGFISDEQMEAELGALFRQSPAFALQYARESVGARAPVNHRRCIWLSNPAFLENERAKRAAAIVAPPRLASAAANRARPRLSSAAAAVPALPSAAVHAVEIPWCFPCTWTSAAGVAVYCGSKDKKKSQHLKSDQHALFLAIVAEHQAADRAEEEFRIEHNIGDVEDPLDLVNLVLNDDDDDDDDASDGDGNNNDNNDHNDNDNANEDDVSSVFYLTPSRHEDLTIGCGGTASVAGGAVVSRRATPTRTVRFEANASSSEGSAAGSPSSTPTRRCRSTTPTPMPKRHRSNK